MLGHSDNLYSRFVSLAKIILPLIGLAILSSLFLFSKSNEPGSGIRLSDADLSEFASKERITGPRFAGMTPSGIAIQLSADQASPATDGGHAFNASDLRAKVEMPDGATIDIQANRGEVNSLTKQAQLTDGITLKTSLGYVATAHGLTFALDKLDIQSQGELTAVGPLGEISAGNLHVTAQTTKGLENPTGYLLVFQNGVKLIYKPKE